MFSSFFEPGDALRALLGGAFGNGDRLTTRPRAWFDALMTGPNTLQKGQRFALARDLGAGLFDPLAAPFDATLAAPATHVFVQRTFDSGHGPSVLELRGADEKVLAELMIKPDDVRRDALVLDLFTLFNYLWRHSFIPDHLSPVALSLVTLPGGADWGFVEFMTDSMPASVRSYTRI